MYERKDWISAGAYLCVESGPAAQDLEGVSLQSISDKEDRATAQASCIMECLSEIKVCDQQHVRTFVNRVAREPLLDKAMAEAIDALKVVAAPDESLLEALKTSADFLTKKPSPFTKMDCRACWIGSDCCS